MQKLCKLFGGIVDISCCYCLPPACVSRSDLQRRQVLLSSVCAQPLSRPLVISLCLRHLFVLLRQRWKSGGDSLLAAVLLLPLHVLPELQCQADHPSKVVIWERLQRKHLVCMRSFLC